MSALPQTGQMLISALRGVSASINAPVLALKRAIERYDNGGTMQEERALAAIRAGRAAFWNTSSYHDTSGTILLDRANAGASLSEALRTAYRFKSNVEKVEALDRLIPLNPLSAGDLALAYSEFGTWRDADELARRAR